MARTCFGARSTYFIAHVHTAVADTSVKYIGNMAKGTVCSRIILPGALHPQEIVCWTGETEQEARYNVRDNLK
jgi:hypothetical protein